MVKNIANKVRLFWQDFAQKEKSEKKMMLKYFLGFFILTVIIIEGIFLWQGKNERAMLSGQEAQAREKNGLIISPAQKDGLAEFNVKTQGTASSSFESDAYNVTKNVATRNADAGLSNEQFNLGTRSLKISWVNGQDKSVQLKNYVATQKDKFYKIGLWISSSKDSHFKLSLLNDEASASIADVGVIGNQDNKFRYYEYNFRAPLDATGVEFFVSGLEPSTIFIDDIKLIPLSIENEEDLSLIKATLIGNNRELKIDQKQIVHPENSDALSVPYTLLGQVFVPTKSDLVGAEFFISKNGNVGVGEYFLEVREFDAEKRTISSKILAVATFSADSIESGNKFFQILAKLEVGKKYWIGFNNGGVPVSKENYLGIGQAGITNAYFGGDGFLQRGENKLFTEEKDLYFSTSYVEPIKTASGDLPYGETIYDLGKGKSHLDFQLDSIDGSSILNNTYAEKNTSLDKLRNPLLGGSSLLDVYEEKNVAVDVWRNAMLSDDESYLVYKIRTDQKNIEKLVLANLIFHYNIELSLSVDGKRWTEIYADNSGKLWQNSGKIEVSFVDSPQDIFVMIRRKGDASSVFLGGYFALDLIDRTYDK